MPVDFAAPAERDDRRMLDDQQAFFAFLENLRVDFFLQCPRIALGQSCEVQNTHRENYTIQITAEELATDGAPINTDENN